MFTGVNSSFSAFAQKPSPTAISTIATNETPSTTNNDPHNLNDHELQIRNMIDSISTSTAPTTDQTRALFTQLKQYSELRGDTSIFQALLSPDVPLKDLLRDSIDSDDGDGITKVRTQGENCKIKSRENSDVSCAIAFGYNCSISSIKILLSFILSYSEVNLIVYSASNLRFTNVK
jgi:hypothetical protein